MFTKRRISLQQQAEVLMAYHNSSEEFKEELNKCMDILRTYFAIRWGELDEIVLADEYTKIHSLLLYKKLGLVWFKGLPDRKNKEFTITVNIEYPKSATTDAILEVSAMTNDALMISCRDIPAPAWVNKKQTITIKTTLDTFPQVTI